MDLPPSVEVRSMADVSNLERGTLLVSRPYCEGGDKDFRLK